MKKRINKLLKNRIFLVVATVLICMSGTVVATSTFFANQLGYTPSDSSFDATNIKEALDILHNMSEQKKISKITEKLLTNNSENTYTYMGGTYLKGEQNNNYLWYNGFMWRIMGKNSDGTIRLITEENVTSFSYGNGNSSYTTTGYIKSWLNDYFYQNLGNVNEEKLIIKSGAYFCADTSTNVSSRQTCNAPITNYAGILSIDEYILSGQSTTNYLINNQYYLTSTPYSNTGVYAIAIDGATYKAEKTNSDGIRPIINVSGDAIVNSGKGNLSNYYLMSTTTDATGFTLSSVGTSGKYVKLEDKLYRIVISDTQGVKLLLDGYYEEPDGTIFKSKFGSNSTFSGSTLDTKLKSAAVLNWLGLTNSTKIVLNSTWYNVKTFNYGSTYTVAMATSNALNRNIGLIRTCEMLSGQSASILTKNYTVRSSNYNAQTYENITTNSNYAIATSSMGSMGLYQFTTANAIRPAIYVKSSLIIERGNGTLENPFEI